MIRYKKRQAGGSAPAQDVAAGASAFQQVSAAGAAGALQPTRTPRSPVQQDSTIGSQKGGSGIGKSMANNISQMGNLKSKNIVKVAEAYNTELQKEREAIIMTYSRNPDYFNRRDGLLRLQEYQKKHRDYQSQINRLEGLYTSMMQESKAGKGNQVAVTQDGQVFVKDHNGKITTLGLDAYADKLNSGTEEFKPEAMTLNHLMTSLDDLAQHSGEKSNFEFYLNQAVSSSMSDQQFIDQFKQNVVNSGRYTPEGLQLQAEDQILTNDQIKDYDGENNEIINKFVKGQLTTHSGVRNKYIRDIAGDNDSLMRIADGESTIDDEVNRKVWEHIRPLFKGKNATKDQTQEAIEANQEVIENITAVVEGSKENSYNQALFNTKDNVDVVTMDSVLNLNPEEPKAFETALKTHAVYVGNNWFKEDFREAVDNENVDANDISIKDFAHLKESAQLNRMQLADGSSITNLPTAKSRGFLPVLDQDVLQVTLPTIDGKLKPWLINLVDDVSELQNEVYKQIPKDSSLSIFKNYDTNKDGSLSVPEREKFINERMQDIYKDMISKYSEISDGTLPRTYDAFKDMQIQQTSFWKVQMIGVPKNDVYNDPKFAPLMAVGMSNLTEDAKRSAKQYNMDGLWGHKGDFWTTDDIVETSVFIPSQISVMDWGNTNPGASRLVDEAHDNRYVKAGDLISRNDDRDIFKGILFDLGK
jgi:hypothetical protein